MKFHLRCRIILLSIILLAGCSGREPVTDDVAVSGRDWRTNGFAISEEISEEQGLWIKSHTAWKHEAVQWDIMDQTVVSTIEPGVSGEKIYRFHFIVESSEAVPVKGILECYDTSMMMESVTELSPEQMGMESTAGSFVVDMDITGDQAGVLQVVGYEVDETGQFIQKSNRMVYFDHTEEIQQAELLPVYLEKGICKEEYGSILLKGECCCDAMGNSYVRSGSDISPYKYLYIMDREGKLLMEWEGSDREEIGVPMKTPEGELIFPVYNREEGTTRMVWYNVGDKQPHTLAVIEEKGFKKLYGMQRNVIYYENDKGIVMWDVESGKRKLVLSFLENGVPHSYNTMLVLQEGKAPVLRTYGEVNDVWEDWLVELSEEPVERPDAIRIVSLEDTSLRVKNCVSVCSRRNPDYSFIYEGCEEKDRAEFRTRIMAEMAAGDGPDILYVSREDMELMQGRGLLEDLRLLLPQETLDKVLPGVLEMGTVEETLAGIAPEISATSILIGAHVCDQDSWTLDDMLILMESGQLEGKLLDGPYCHASKNALVLLLRYYLEDSFLIDWEKRESHFEDERFLRLVEYMGGNNEAQRLENAEDPRTLGGGSLMVISGISSSYHAGDFYGTRAAKGSHYIGFPTESGNGNYLEASGMVVVNKNLTNRLAVSAYMETLLGDEVQDIADVGTGLSVVPLGTDDIVYISEEGTAWWQGREILVYQDGTTSLHEVNAFLEQCVPAPRKYAALENIIMEEVSAYYAGDRTAETVAAQIDNRVQVYLNEGD